MTTVDEKVAEMVKAANQECPLCHHRAGDHQVEELMGHLSAAWQKITAAFGDLAKLAKP